MSNEVILKVGGYAYSGWTSIIIEKSLRQMAGSFGLATTNPFPGQARKWNIGLGNECIVEINKQKVITGYIEDIVLDYDSTTHNIQFGGRDKTGDLIDCSYDEVVKEWQGLSILKIIKTLCNPFSIDVVVDSSAFVAANSVWWDNFKANEGDTIFDLISKICRMKAILPVSYSDGKLTLTRAGTTYKATDVLLSGKNVLKAKFDQSDKDRYQTYIVKGQGIGDDNKVTLPMFTGNTGRATDSVIKRYRPIVIFTETPSDNGKCLERAKWEKNTRAGASRSLTYEVRGWTQSDGNIWPLNAMVQVNDREFGINETLLIADLSFLIDEINGEITRMRVVSPDAFTTKPFEIKSGFDLFS